MRRLSSSVTLLLTLALAACGGGGDGGPSGPRPVADVEVTLSSPNLDVGGTAQAVASLRDANGGTTSGQVTWTSSNEVVATVSTSGLITARYPGSATITATSGVHSDSKAVQVRTLIATIEVTGSQSSLGVGATVQLTATALDATGGTVSGKTFTWSSSNDGIATVSASGVVTAHAAGPVVITAFSETKSGTYSLDVVAPNSPVITAITPATLVPGMFATITGSNFSFAGSGDTVTIAGLKAPITQSSANHVEIVVPSRGLFPCQPTQDAAVVVRSAGLSATQMHPLAVAHQRALAVGQSVRLIDQEQAHCNEMTGVGGRYIVSVFNSTPVLGAQTPFNLRGAGATVVAAPSAAPQAPSYAFVGAGAAAATLAGRAALNATLQAEERVHARVLENNRRSASRLGSPRARWSAAREARATAARRTTAGGTAATSAGEAASVAGDVQAIVARSVPGEKLWMRIYKIWDANSNSCAAYDSVRVRHVLTSSRAIIMEDTAAPVAGTMDAQLATFANEFDNLMFPILETNFGNPLAMESQANLGTPGRIVMVFTPKLNNSSVAGFVVSCDYYPRSQAPASNQDEVFYARAATKVGSGFDTDNVTDTPEEWLWTMRSTIIHELKHLAAFSTRFASGATLEESWLEEGTARHAEEIWARQIYGAAWKGNARYGSDAAPGNLWCDVRPTWPQCTGKPQVMYKHYNGLYRYLQSVETRTMLGSATSGDATYYASAWHFVRWAVDHHAASEAAFLKALVAGPNTGVANIQSLTGRSYADMLSDYALALAVDDYPGVTLQRAQHTIPTWHSRDIFAGMNTDFPTGGGSYPLAFPLAMRAFSAGASVTVPAVWGGTGAYFDFTGGTAPQQFLELRASNGTGPAPVNLGMSIVRVQ
jgi:hypothetical protein